MKITFDHQAFTMQSYGGISRYYSHLAEELINLEQSISIYAGIHRNNYLSGFSDGVVKGLKVNKFPPKTLSLLLATNHYWSEYQISRHKPDIIHETYYSLNSSHKKIAPRVVTAYDMIHELYAHTFKNNKTTKWKKKAYNRADHIISISKSTKDDMIEIFDIPEEKISVVYLAADYFPEPKNCITNFKFSKPFLLYVGSRDGYKNFESLLRAVSLSKTLKKEFDIVAFGGGKFTSRENILINSLQFTEGEVKQISGGDFILGNLYREAVALVYPSKYEGFGLPPLEAMACKCPVISSNTSSMPEVINEAGEFFNPNEIEDITSAIKNVVFSESRMQDLKIKGSQRVKDFSWKKCAMETLSIYKKMRK